MTKITSVSKRMLSMLMALFMLCSCMVVANAAISVPAPTYEINSSKTAITVDPITVDGVAADISISPSDGIEELELKDGSKRFDGVTTGKTYTITATVTTDTDSGSNSVNVTLKKSQSVPEVKAAKTVTATSIEIPNVTGGEYMIEGEGIETPAWGSTTKFTDLTPDTLYTISIRFKETTDKYASEATKLTVRTLMSAKTGKPDAPVLEDKTMTTITVKEQSGVIFSRDLTNWQSSGKFTGLTAGVTYSIYAMYDYDETEQEAGEVSNALVVKTNTKANSPATLDDCKITIETDDKNYANQPIDFAVEVKSTYATYKAEYGDTIYIPTSYQIDDGAKVTIPRIKGTKFTASFTPGASKANKTIKFTINFTKMKYVGGTEWIDIGEETSTVHKIDIGPEYTFFTRISEFFVTAFNFLFDTVPGYLSDFLKSDAVTGYFDFFLGLGETIDIGALLGNLGLGGGTTT